MPSTEDLALATLLRSRGHRVTLQRLIILSAVRDAEGHVTALDIARAVNESYAGIDASTVYRSLMAAVDDGLITRFDQAGEEIQFEWNSAPHHHLVCDRCGGVDTLAPDVLAPLGSSLMQQKGFAADLRHVAVRGTCADCRDE